MRSTGRACRPVGSGRSAGGGAAEAAGLRAGDLVLRVDGQPVVDGQQLRRWIRQAPVTGARAYQVWWLPVYSVFARRPPRQQSSGSAAQAWSIAWEEA